VLFPAKLLKKELSPFRNIGGCDDLYQLDSQKQLDPLLTQPAG
jgi:hypothetical protein